MDNTNRRGRVSRFQIITVLILLVVAAAVVLLGAFQIERIEIAGNSAHAAEEIKDDLIYDFATGNTLYFCWKYRNPVYEPRAPYLDTVQAKFLSPSGVRLTVTEKTLAGQVVYGGEHVYFDSSGLVVDISDVNKEEVTLITGVATQEPVLYQRLQVSSAALLRTMLSISQLLKEAGLKPDSISFDETLNIKAMFGTLEVELGQDEYLDGKVSSLRTVFSQVKDQKGVLDMTAYTGRGGDIPFTPAGQATSTITPAVIRETEVQTEAETEDTARTEKNDENDTPVRQESPYEQNTQQSYETTPVQVGVTFQVFDSYGNFYNGAYLAGGFVYDAYGNLIPGCSVNEYGNVVDGYGNEINPLTGQTVNLYGW